MTATQFTEDFKIVGTLDGSEPTTRVFDVDASGSGATISKGDLVILDSTAGYVKKAPDGAANTSQWVGIATSDSDETGSVDGTVAVAFSTAGLVVRGAPTTPGNLALALKLTRVTLDVSGGGVQTVDENDTTNGVLRVLTYDTTNSTIDVVVPCHLPFVS